MGSSSGISSPPFEQWALERRPNGPLAFAGAATSPQGSRASSVTAGSRPANFFPPISCLLGAADLRVPDAGADLVAGKLPNEDGGDEDRITAWSRNRNGGEGGRPGPLLCCHWQPNSLEGRPRGRRQSPPLLSPLQAFGHWTPVRPVARRASHSQGKPRKIRFSRSSPGKQPRRSRRRWKTRAVSRAGPPLSEKTT